MRFASFFFFVDDLECKYDIRWSVNKVSTLKEDADWVYDKYKGVRENKKTDMQHCSDNRTP